MRSKLVLAAVVIALAGLIFWASKGAVLPRSEGWPQEPKVYLGVKLGEPLEVSVPRCRNAEDRRLCFDGSYIANEPDPVSSTVPFIEEGIVTQVNTTYRASAESLIREDLKQRFGEPQSSFSGMEMWKGQVITLTLMSAGKNDVGFLTAALVHPPNADADPHKNPF